MSKKELSKDYRPEIEQVKFLVPKRLLPFYITVANLMRKNRLGVYSIDDTGETMPSTAFEITRTVSHSIDGEDIWFTPTLHLEDRAVTLATFEDPDLFRQIAAQPIASVTTMMEIKSDAKEINNQFRAQLAKALRAARRTK